jgi:hypothetical protein
MVIDKIKPILQRNIWDSKAMLSTFMKTGVKV